MTKYFYFHNFEKMEYIEKIVNKYGDDVTWGFKSIDEILKNLERHNITSAKNDYIVTVEL